MNPTLRVGAERGCDAATSPSGRAPSGTFHSDLIVPTRSARRAVAQREHRAPDTMPSAGVPHEPSCLICVIRPPSFGNETGAPSTANEKSAAGTSGTRSTPPVPRGTASGGAGGSQSCCRCRARSARRRSRRRRGPRSGRRAFPAPHRPVTWLKRERSWQLKLTHSLLSGQRLSRASRPTASRRRRSRGCPLVRRRRRGSGGRRWRRRSGGGRRSRRRRCRRRVGLGGGAGPARCCRPPAARSRRSAGCGHR